MFTWFSTRVVLGVNLRTGEAVLFLVDFDVRGQPNYTPLASGYGNLAAAA